MDIKFNGKRALVTGAGKGIGRELAIKLANGGAEVIAVSRTQEDLDELENLHPNIKTICLDVGDWKATEDALQNIGIIDLLVNNAGILKYNYIETTTEDFVDETYNINFKAIINITKLVVKGMKDRGNGGSIVNISSVSALRGLAQVSVYATSKCAIDHFTRCMAVELGSHNIRVNSVCPTVIRTRLVADLYNPDNKIGQHVKAGIPLGRFGEVDEAVYPILFLLSDQASLITGVALPIDGGASVAL